MHFALSSEGVKIVDADTGARALYRESGTIASHWIAVSMYENPEFDRLIELLEMAQQNTFTDVYLFGNLTMKFTVAYRDADLYRTLSKVFQFRGIVSLTLSQFGFNCDMIELICEWAAPLTVKHLNLFGNALTSRGLRAVGRLVMRNKFLEGLSISVRCDTDHAVVELCECLRRNFTLQTVAIFPPAAMVALKSIEARNRQWKTIRRHLISVAFMFFAFELPIYVLLALVDAYLIEAKSNAALAESEFPQYIKMELLENVVKSGKNVVEQRNK